VRVWAGSWSLSKIMLLLLLLHATLHRATWEMLSATPTTTISPLILTHLVRQASKQSQAHPMTACACINLIEFFVFFHSIADYEVRNVWQPWLKRKCDFAVRYIVPDRVNILRIMRAQGRFSHHKIVSGCMTG
jgi:hypothetical protein